MVKHNNLIGDFDFFSKKIDEINEEIKIKFYSEDYEPLYDGPLDRKSYFDSKLKILWLLKEPYSVEDGGSKMEEWFADPRFKNRKKIGNTWKRIIYIVNGILNNKKWDDLDEINPETFDNLKYIAWINIQKVPYKDDWRTNDGDIKVAFNGQKTSEILLKQIELLTPDVIICGNTFEIVNATLFKSEYKKSFNKADLYLNHNTAIIDAYHPGRRLSLENEQKYVDDILDAVFAGLLHLQND